MTQLLNTTIEDLKNGSLTIISEEVKYPKTIHKKSFIQTMYFSKHIDGTKRRVGKKVRLQMMEILNTK